MKFEPDSNSLLKTYSKPIQKFRNFAITFVLHQYLTTKNIINSKNAQSHLAFDQTPSICTLHICKKIRNFIKLDGVLLLLHSFSSPSALQCVGASGDHGAGAAESKGHSGARAALDRDHGKGGAHFEGGGDGRSPATRTAGSWRHAVTGTAVSGRHPATGTRRVGSGRHAVTGTRTAGSGMPATRTARARGGDGVGGGVDGEVEQPNGGGGEATGDEN